MCVCLDFSNQFSSPSATHTRSLSLCIALCVCFPSIIISCTILLCFISLPLPCNVFLYLFNSLGLVSWLLPWLMMMMATLFEFDSSKNLFAFWQIHLQRLLTHFVFAYLIDVKIHIYIYFICILFRFFLAFSVSFFIYFIWVNFILFYFAYFQALRWNCRFNMREKLWFWFFLSSNLVMYADFHLTSIRILRNGFQFS